MNNNPQRGVVIIALVAICLCPTLAHASVESSLMGLKTTLLSGVLPVLAVMALGFAAFQFFTGNPNSKTYLIYAVVGSVILFGAQSIVDLLSRVVRWMLNNPTGNLKKSQLWGFEISHIIVSFGLMMVSNFLLSALKLPVFTSWIVGILCLMVLRIMSIGKKAGHLGFLMNFLIKPRIHLGCTLRNHKRGEL